MEGVYEDYNDIALAASRLGITFFDRLYRDKSAIIVFQNSYGQQFSGQRAGLYELTAQLFTLSSQFGDSGNDDEWKRLIAAELALDSCCPAAHREYFFSLNRDLDKDSMAQASSDGLEESVDKILKTPEQIAQTSFSLGMTFFELIHNITADHDADNQFTEADGDKYISDKRLYFELTINLLGMAVMHRGSHRDYFWLGSVKREYAGDSSCQDKMKFCYMAIADLETAIMLSNDRSAIYVYSAGSAECTLAQKLYEQINATPHLPDSKVLEKIERLYRVGIYNMREVVSHHDIDTFALAIAEFELAEVLEIKLDTLKSATLNPEIEALHQEIGSFYRSSIERCGISRRNEERNDPNRMHCLGRAQLGLANYLTQHTDVFDVVEVQSLYTNAYHNIKRAALKEEDVGNNHWLGVVSYDYGQFLERFTEPKPADKIITLYQESINCHAKSAEENKRSHDKYLQVRSMIALADFLEQGDDLPEAQLPNDSKNPEELYKEAKAMLEGIAEESPLCIKLLSLAEYGLAAHLDSWERMPMLQSALEHAQKSYSMKEEEDTSILIEGIRRAMTDDL